MQDSTDTTQLNQDQDHLQDSSDDGVASSKNADQFLALYNKLERYLRSANDSTKHVGFKRLVDKLSQRDALLALYKQDLIEFVELRNAIVHRSTGAPIAQPTDQALERMNELYEKLTHPPTALEIATTPVFTCSTAQNISEVVKTMQQKRYTYVPVYHSDSFVGVFSERSLTMWLASVATEDSFDLTQKTIGQLQDFFDKQDDKYNAYMFVEKDANAFNIRDHFVQFMEDHKRLAAVYVTRDGSFQQEILGIITAWDIHKLSQFVQ